MSTEAELHKELTVLRSEFKNIRQQLETLKRIHKKDVANIKTLLNEERNAPSKAKQSPSAVIGGVSHCGDEGCLQLKPIGLIESMFQAKNGTPRQASVCQSSHATLRLHSDLFNNPEHSLEGLEQYSHIWVVYVFHKNNNSYSKAKVAPPRLNGARVGIFSTRCPYRPCPIGLSLVKITRIHGGCVELSGVDMLDGTPVLDIKPYIPLYDNPSFHGNQPQLSGISPSARFSPVGGESRILENSNDISEPAALQCDLPEKVSESSNREDTHKQTEDSQDGAHTNPLNTSEEPKSRPETVNYAEWVKSPPISPLSVIFTARAEKDLVAVTNTPHPERHIEGYDATRKAIIDILEQDTRSTYRREKCKDRLYYVDIDNLHITAWFDENFVEILRIKCDTQ